MHHKATLLCCFSREAGHLGALNPVTMADSRRGMEHPPRARTRLKIEPVQVHRPRKWSHKPLARRIPAPKTRSKALKRKQNAFPHVRRAVAPAPTVAKNALRKINAQRREEKTQKKEGERWQTKKGGRGRTISIAISVSRRKKTGDNGTNASTVTGCTRRSAAWRSTAVLFPIGPTTRLQRNGSERPHRRLLRRVVESKSSALPAPVAAAQRVKVQHLLRALTCR
jgi:hypothetical protein